MSADSTDRGEFWSSRRTIGAAVLVCIIALVAVILVLLPAASSEQADEPALSDSSPLPALPRTPEPCPPAEDDAPGTLSESDLTNISWSLDGMYAIPRSSDAGPASVTDSGLPACFAKSPRGAALFAANFGAHTFQETSYESALDELTIADPNRKELKQQLADQGVPETASQYDIQIAGVRLDSFNASNETATVTLAYRVQVANGGSGLAGETYELQWSDGDWRYLVPAGARSNGGEIASLDGFIPWSGVNDA